MEHKEQIVIGITGSTVIVLMDDADALRELRSVVRSVDEWAQAHVKQRTCAPRVGVYNVGSEDAAQTVALKILRWCMDRGTIDARLVTDVHEVAEHEKRMMTGALGLN
jgi:uncharacterized protein YlxP (DUF503 family)